MVYVKYLTETPLNGDYPDLREESLWNKKPPNKHLKKRNNMNISGLLLAIWLILVGVTWLAWVTIDIKFLGLLGFITGILVLIDGVHPITLRRP